MKDIKSFIIGFLCCACMFLFMGANKKLIPHFKDNAMNGRYQLLEFEFVDKVMGFVIFDTQIGKSVAWWTNTTNENKIKELNRIMGHDE